MVGFFKKLIFKIYVLALMSFTVWYGYFMYHLIFGFEGKEGAEISLKKMGDAGTEEEQMFVRLIAEQVEQSKTDLGYKVLEQPYIKGRFHHIGFNIQKDNVSICIRCHGNVPHSKSKKVRSFLNMHAFYLACETCHAIPDEGTQWTFRWYDKDTGEITENPEQMAEIEEIYRTERDRTQYPVYGDYGAKIAPMKLENGEYRLLHGEKEMAFIERYRKEQQQLKSEKRSQMKKIIHRQVSKDPVQCEACHQGDKPYIDFAGLGYPETRERELKNLAVIGMLKKYEQFYIPDFFKSDIK